MNKTPRLSKSGIEYLDFQWGVFSGCRNLERGICPVTACWAKSITKRAPANYPNGFEPTFYLDALESPLHIKKPSRIGVAWVGDVIGYGLENKWWIYDTIEACPQHTFLFLTKNPQNLAKFSPFPENCWVGVTATDHYSFLQAQWYLHVEELQAKIKYISFEPLLAEIPLDNLAGINWVIIGAQTKPTVLPKLEWVREIETAATKAGIPVFEKNNLRPLLKRELRQEFPNG